jgi:beta-phosphoglucomutase-like phosphatase (HAD superfamily)
MNDLMFENIDALIFDCDGTLVDTAPLYYMAFSQALKPYGAELPREWYAQRTGASEDVVLDGYEKTFGVSINRAECVKELRQIFLSSLPTVSEIPEVVGIARAKKGTLRLAVASGGSRELVMATLNSTGLVSLFETIVTVDDVPKPKPAPDLFIEAARRLKSSPERCLVFEDSKEGIEAARRAGMKVCDVASLRGRKA